MTLCTSLHNCYVEQGHEEGSIVSGISFHFCPLLKDKYGGLWVSRL